MTLKSGTIEWTASRAVKREAWQIFSIAQRGCVDDITKETIKIKLNELGSEQS